MDKYYDWLYSECRCEECRYHPGECPYCVNEREREAEYQAAIAREEQLAAAAAAAAVCPNAQWREQIAFIKGELDAVARGPTLYERLTHVRILFTEIQNERYQAFIAAQPKFRAALVKKVAELKADPKAEALVELFEHTERMVEGLAARPEFKA